MAIGVLLITHPGIGSATLAVATRLLRSLPLRCEALEVARVERRVRRDHHHDAAVG